jgi:hypothetical protein
MINPQIINGGQTAYTLSQIYLQNDGKDPFKGKEVMLKIVTLKSKNGRRHDFIGLISNATNQQNPVTEADRRSNSSVLEELQTLIFRDYGFFFERKRGEFFNGSKKGFMAGQRVINRAELIRAWYAYLGMPTSARRSETNLFDEKQLVSVLPTSTRFREVFFSYLLLQALKYKQRQFKKGRFKCVRCTNAFSYGRYAVVAAGARIVPNVKVKIRVEDLERVAENSIIRVLGKWQRFERFARSRSKNKRYFNARPANFDNYYKGNTLDDDVRAFSW